jgi:hypothetical protein
MGTWDPLPHLAALIDGLRQLAAQPAGDPDSVLTEKLAWLLTGPYAALRGGLLLDEPGREGVATEEALREVLVPDPAALDDDQLDDLVRNLDERLDAAVRENNRRAASKLLDRPAREPRVLRDVRLVSWGPVLDPPWPDSEKP